MFKFTVFPHMDFYGKEKVQEVENVLHTLLHIEVGQLLSQN